MRGKLVRAVDVSRTAYRKQPVDVHGIGFERKGAVGIITFHPPRNGNCADYDPKLALQGICEEIKGDESIALFFHGRGEQTGSAARDIRDRA